jgi:hypothetical protein
MELIRKIIVGQNPKDAMAYFVGQKTGDSVVDSIIQDERALALYGIRRYLVYIYNSEKGTMLWKTIDDMPCLIEHDCDF